jgi:hypothetical protein
MEINLNLIFIVSGEQERNLSNFMTLPTMEEERQCYENFYDATSNEALKFQVCPVCGRERLAKEGERNNLLSDPCVVELLTTLEVDEAGRNRNRLVIIGGLLDVDEGVATCWMCFDCIRALERHMVPKMALVNNLWIGEVPPQLTDLTIPEQLLIARHYPRCYIFKLFPRDVNIHIPLDQLYSGMAGNASLFEMNTQEVVEMLKGQRMPSPVRTLASVIAITFVSKKTLPVDWLKKTFRVRRAVVYDALVWLQKNNPIYGDISIDRERLRELPEDGVPEELLTVVRQEEDDEVAEKERESYLAAVGGGNDDDSVREAENIEGDGEY